MHFAANCGNIIRRYCFAAEYALVAQPVEHLTFNQRARDSSSLERTKIPRRIVRFLVGFSFFWGSAHFCTLFAHRRESRVFPCIVCILCIVSGTCRGEAPPSCWHKTVLSLKSPTGAFIAALRSQTRACRGEAPPSCWRKTVLSLKSPTGAFIAALRLQTRTLLCKMLVGKSQPLSNLHRPGAGCAMESLNSTKACWSPDGKKKRQSR